MVNESCSASEIVKRKRRGEQRYRGKEFTFYGFCFLREAGGKARRVGGGLRSLKMF